MNTITICLNDTVALSDSTIIELAKVVNTCQSCMQGNPTNCNDVKIVAIICAAIIIAALIAWGIISTLKCKELCANNQAKQEKDAKEEKERINRTDADLKQRKIDLQNRLLTFLEKNTSKGDYNKDKQELLSTMKEITSKETQYYIKVLKALISDADIPDFPQDLKRNERKE